MLRRRAVIALAWVGSLAVAFAIASARSRDESPEPPVAGPARIAAPAPGRLVVAPAAGVSPEEVRRIIRDELAAAAVAVEPPGAPEEPPGSAATFDEARAVVRGAVERGHWSTEARAAFRLRLTTLDRAQRDEVLRDLFVALNDGRLQIDPHEPPI